MKKQNLTAGEVIFNSTICLKRAAAEIEAMIKHFVGDLEDCLFESKIIKRNGLIEQEIYYDADPHEWLTLGTLWNYDLIPPPNRSTKPKACIGIKIALAEEDETRSEIPKEPLIHVLFYGRGEAEWKYNEFEIPPKLKEDDEDTRIILRSERLWEWFGGDEDENTCLDWKDRKWAFSLPLTAINTIQDIRKQICEPIAALIKGEEPDIAFKIDSKVIRLKSKMISSGN